MNLFRKVQKSYFEFHLLKIMVGCALDDLFDDKISEIRIKKVEDRHFELKEYKK
jgi:hypothetical protein